MKLGVCAQALYHLSFDEALALAEDIGFEAIELPVDAKNPFLDMDELLKGDVDSLQRRLSDHGLEISALSNHQEGQLLLGPHASDTDGIFSGSADEKSDYATRRLRQSAELAARLGVDVVCGFVGCEDYSRWFPWPDPAGFEKMGAPFREKMMPILDSYHELGVRFAHECHPRQLAYNLETAQWVVEILDQHPAFCFNFDPANLMLAGMEPENFIAELGSRIVHVHAKDGEVVRHSVARSGLLAHGAWGRPGRGFRFRAAGWGDLSWKRLISELQHVGYRGVLSVEHEDPLMSQEEGLRKAMDTLRPLRLVDPMPGERWW